MKLCIVCSERKEHGVPATFKKGKERQEAFICDECLKKNKVSA